MRRGNLALIVLVVLSGAAGGVAAVDLGGSFATEETVPLLQRQLAVELTDAGLTDDGFRISTRVTNPTRYPVTIAGGFIQMYEDDSRLAYGTVSLADPVKVPPGEERTFSLTVSLTPAERERLNQTSGGVAVRHQYATRFRDTQFVLRGSETRVDIEVEG